MYRLISTNTLRFYMFFCYFFECLIMLIIYINILIYRLIFRTNVTSKIPRDIYRHLSLFQAIFQLSFYSQDRIHIQILPPLKNMWARSSNRENFRRFPFCCRRSFSSSPRGNAIYSWGAPSSLWIWFRHNSKTIVSGKKHYIPKTHRNRVFWNYTSSRNLYQNQRPLTWPFMVR